MTERWSTPALGALLLLLLLPVLSATDSAGRETLRRGAFKMMHIPSAGGPPERLLFDLVRDRSEEAANPIITREFGAQLGARLAEDTGEEREYHVSDESLGILRSLGYVN